MTPTTPQKTPTPPELILPTKTAAALLLIPGEEASRRHLTLNGHLNAVQECHKEIGLFPGRIQTARLNLRVSLGLLEDVNTGTLAIVTVEHPTALGKLSSDVATEAETKAQLLLEVLAEVGTQNSHAASVGQRRVLAHHQSCKKTLETLIEAQSAAVDEAFELNLSLQRYVLECQGFIHGQTPAGHPARAAVKRKVLRRAGDPSEAIQAELDRVKAKEAAKLEKAKAKLAREEAELLRVQEQERAKLVKQSGVTQVQSASKGPAANDTAAKADAAS